MNVLEETHIRIDVIIIPGYNETIDHGNSEWSEIEKWCINSVMVNTYDPKLTTALVFSEITSSSLNEIYIRYRICNNILL